MNKLNCSTPTDVTRVVVSGNEARRNRHHPSSARLPPPRQQRARLRLDALSMRCKMTRSIWCSPFCRTATSVHSRARPRAGCSAAITVSEDADTSRVHGTGARVSGRATVQVGHRSSVALGHSHGCLIAVIALVFSVVCSAGVGVTAAVSLSHSGCCCIRSSCARSGRRVRGRRRQSHRHQGVVPPTLDGRWRRCCTAPPPGTGARPRQRPPPTAVAADAESTTTTASCSRSDGACDDVVVIMSSVKSPRSPDIGQPPLPGSRPKIRETKVVEE